MWGVGWVGGLEAEARGWEGGGGGGGGGDGGGGRGIPRHPSDHLFFKDKG